MNEEDLHAMQVLTGRVDALHAVLYVIARTLPVRVAEVAARQVRLGGERLHANRLGESISDAQLDEMNRVMVSLAEVMEAVVRNPPEDLP